MLVSYVLSVAYGTIMLSVVNKTIMLSVAMLSVAMLSVVMLSVVVHILALNNMFYKSLSIYLHINQYCKKISNKLERFSP
jgi:hypothetical protein